MSQQLLLQLGQCPTATRRHAPSHPPFHRISRAAAHFILLLLTAGPHLPNTLSAPRCNQLDRPYVPRRITMKFASQALAVAWAASQANAQWSHRLNAPCGRGENSESKLMCGQTPCPERMTIDRTIKGRGKPRTEPGVMSNSLFNVYQTNGPDLTIDT